MFRVLWYFQDCDCVLFIGHVWYPQASKSCRVNVEDEDAAGIASIHPPFRHWLVILWVTHRKMWDHKPIETMSIVDACSLFPSGQCIISFNLGKSYNMLQWYLTFKAILPINTRGFVGRFICPTGTNKFHCPKDGTYTVEMLGFCWTICWLPADITSMRIVRIQWFNSTAIYQ